MHPRERVSYSAIKDRKPLKLPDGLRLIVWPVLALEEWDMARPMARIMRLKIESALAPITTLTTIAPIRNA